MSFEYSFGDRAAVLEKSGNLTKEFLKRLNLTKECFSTCRRPTYARARPPGNSRQLDGKHWEYLFGGSEVGPDFFNATARLILLKPHLKVQLSDCGTVGTKDRIAC